MKCLSEPRIQIAEVSQRRSQVSASIITCRDISTHWPIWGGLVRAIPEDFDTNEEYEMFCEFNNQEITNTCSVDYFLLFVWCASRLSVNTMQVINNNRHHRIARYILKLIALIDQEEWNRAKTVWLLAIANLQETEDFTFSAFGDQHNIYSRHVDFKLEENYLILNKFYLGIFYRLFFSKRHLAEFQRISYSCDICDTNRILHKSDFFFRKIGDQCYLTSIFCSVCETQFKLSFDAEPFYLIVDSLVGPSGETLGVQDLPEQIDIDNRTFKLFCCTFQTKHHNVEHFKAIIKLGNQFYVVDDLNNKKTPSTKVPNHQVCNALYYLI